MADVPLRDYVDKRLCELDRRVFQAIEDRDKRVDVALQAAKEAVVEAKEGNERRLALLNEFRAQSTDEARKYALSVLVDQHIAVLTDRINRNEASVAVLQGRAIALAASGTLLGGIVGGLIVKWLGQ